MNIGVKRQRARLAREAGEKIENSLPPEATTMFPPGTIETYTGDTYNFENPNPSHIHLDDIAHALGNHCRYAGHTKRFYSVAEHSVLVSKILEEERQPTFWQMVGLFHDGHEAYVMDAPRPLKPLLGEAFERVADKADIAIATWLREHVSQDEWPGRVNVLTGDFHADIIKRADNMALVHERKQLMTARPHQWESGYEDVPELPGNLNEWTTGVSPRAAEAMFLKRAKDLGVTE